MCCLINPSPQHNTPPSTRALLRLAIALLLAGLLLCVVFWLPGTPARAEGELRISKTASTDTLKAGEPLTYTLCVTNNTGGILSVSVRDKVPEGAKVIDTGSGALNNGEMTWTGLLIQPASTATMMFTVEVTRTGSLVNADYRAASGQYLDLGDPVTTMVVPGDPETIVIIADPNPGTVGTSSDITISVSDAFGNAVADGTPVTIEFDRGTMDGQPAGATIIANTSGGRIVKTLAGGTEVGTAHITATVDGIPPAIAELLLVPGPPDSLSVTASPSTIPANGSTSSTIIATVTDQYGNFVTQTPVTITTDLGDINAGGPTAVVDTDDSGQALATLKGTVAGTATITVTVDQYPGGSGSLVDASQHVYLAPGSPTHVLIHAAPTDITANGISTSTITTLVLDEHDNPVDTTLSVTITTNLGAFPGGGAQYTETTRDGMVQVPLKSGTQAGVANVVATALGLNTATTVDFSPGPPALISLEIEPTAIPADGMSTATLTATVRDLFGNPVSTPVGVTFATEAGTWLPDSGGDTVNGIIVRNLRSSVTLGTTPVTATAAGISMPATSSVDFVTGPPSSADVSLTPASPLTVGVPATVVVTVHDSVGHVVPGVPITVTSWLGSISPSSTGVTDGSGQLIRTLVSDQVGLDEIRVFGPDGLLSVNGGSVSFVPAAATQAYLRAYPSQILADGNTTAVVTGTVTDRYGNPIPNIVPDFTTTLGLLTGDSATNASGVATRTLHSTPELGTAILSVSGLITVTNATVEFVSGPPAAAILDAQPNTATADGLSTVSLVITVTDSVGHPIVGQTLIVTSSLGTLTGCGATSSQGVLNCSLHSTRSGEAFIYVAGIPATGDTITFVPGPLHHIEVTPGSFQFPVGVAAGVSFTFSAVGHDIYHNPITGLSFVWSTSSMGGQGTVNSSGVFVGTRVGLVRIKASAGGKSGVSYALVGPGQAAVAFIEADPLVVPANGTDTSSLTFHVADAYGNAVAYGVPLTVTSSIGTIEGTSTTDANGVAYRTIRSLQAGPALIDVSNLVTITGGTVITFTPGIPHKAIVSASPAELHANGSDQSTLTITLLDAFDNPVSAGYTPTVQASLGTISGTGSTDATGAVTRTLTAPMVEGVANFTVKYSEVTLPVSGDVVAFVVGLLDHLDVSPAGPISLPAGQPTMFTAQGYDAFNAPLPPGRVNYGWDLITDGPGSGQRDPMYGPQTTFTGTLAGAGVQLNVWADESGAFFEAPVDINVLPGPPISAMITTDPVAVTADGVSPLTFTLTSLVDDYGNLPVDGTVITVTVQSQPVVRTNTGLVSSGQAHVILTATTQAGTYPVFASSSAGAMTINGDTSVTFVPGPPAQAEVVSATPPAIVADGTSTSTVVLQLRDVFGNQVAGGWNPVVSSTLATIIPGGYATDATGILSRTLQAGLVVGDALISVDGFAATGPSVHLIPGPPVLANVTIVTSTLRVGGESTPVYFDVRDAWDHPVADGTTITPTLSPVRGTFSGVRDTFRGMVTQTLSSGTSDGTASVGSEGLTATGDTLVTFVPGPAAMARVFADPSALKVGETTALTISVTDAYSNVVSPTSIVMTATLGTLDGSAPTITKTTASGTGSFTASLSSTRAGTETLVFGGPTGQLVTDPASDAILFLPDEPLYVTLEPAGPATVAAGAVLTITASSRDVYGNAVDPWSPVDYGWWQSATSGGSGYGTLTAGDPHARTVTFTPLSIGANRLWATGGVTTSNVLTVNVITGPPATATININPSSVPADGTGTFAIMLTGVADVMGNLVPDATPLTATVSSDPPIVGVGSTWGGAMSMVLTSSTHAGNYAVLVQGVAGPLTLSGDSTIQFEPGPPVRAFIDATPENLPADGTSTAALLVTVRDINYNPVSNGTPITVTASLGTVTGQGNVMNGTLERTLQAPMTLGTADFTVEGPNGPLAVTGDTVQFVPGDPATAWVTAMPAQITADEVSTSQLTITIKDANGFTIGGTGTAELNVDRGLVVPASIIVSGGSFTSTFTAGRTVGPVALSVNYDGVLLPTAGDTLRLVPGPAVSATISAAPTSLRAGSTDRSILTLNLLDAWGHPVVDGTVVTVTTSLGEILPDSSTTVGGVVTRTLTPGFTIGTANFSASTPEGSLTLSGDSVEITAGSLDHIEISPYGSVVVTAGSSVTFSAVGHDIFDNETGTGLFLWTLWRGTGDGILSGDGVPSSQAVFTATTAGVVGIQASQEFKYSPIANVQVVSGVPTTAVVSADPITVPVGGGVSELTITAWDAYGNLVADGTSLDVTSNIGTILGTSTTQNGSLSRTFLSGDFYGVATIFVNGWEAAGDKIILAGGGPASAQLTAKPSSLYADGTSQTELSLDLFDAAGLPVADGTMPTITSTLGTLSGWGGTKDGVLTRTLQASRTPGVARIYVDDFMAEGGVSFNVGPASVAYISADPPWLIPNGVNTSTLTITVQDAFGHVITDAGPLTVTASFGTISDFEPTVNGVTTRVLTVGNESGTAIISVVSQGGAGPELATAGDSKVHFVGNSVIDGGFESEGLQNWTLGNVISTTSSSPAYAVTALSSDTVNGISILTHGGTRMVRIGATTSDNTDHKQSEVWLSQPFSVPPSGLTQITFWYRLLSYDVSIGSEQNGFKEWDPFEVYVNGQQVFQDGYPFSDEWYAWYQSFPTSPRDMGWKQSVLDLTRYSGQVVTLEFRLPNNRDAIDRNLEVDNTWVYLDDVSMLHSESENFSVFLPLVLSKN